jgi:hypothetical protein
VHGRGEIHAEKVATRLASRRLPIQALLALSLAACQIPQVTSANLDALHDEQGRHLYRVALMTPSRFILGRLVPVELGVKFGASLRDPKLEKVKDPSEVCLETLLELADSDQRGPAMDAARVRHAAFLAIEDPSLLTRERAFLQVGKEAERLELGAPERPPEEIASASDLAAALVEVVDALRPVLALGGRAGQAERERLVAACAVVNGMAVDLQGGWRALRTVERLFWTRRGDEPEFEPVWEMSRRLQERVVRRVLFSAASDPSELVRAAAITANWRAYGERYLMFLLEDVRRSFRSGQALAYDRIDLVRLLDLIRDHDLPRSADLDAERASVLRHEQLGLLMTIAVRVSEFDEHVRAAAMRALGAVSGSGFQSLRFEDWTAWWQSQAAQRADALERAAAGKEEGPGDALDPDRGGS